MKLGLDQFVGKSVRIKFGNNSVIGNLSSINDKDGYVLMTECRQSSVRTKHISIEAIDSIGLFVQEK